MSTPTTEDFGSYECNAAVEAARARTGADRMALGLSCIPDPVLGDIREVEKLHEVIKAIAGMVGLTIERYNQAHEAQP